jgi:hypothetical protein
MAKSAKSTVKPFQLIGPGVIGGVSESPPIKAPITLAAAGVDKPLAKRAKTLVLVLIAASALTWAALMAIHSLK